MMEISSRRTKTKQIHSATCNLQRCAVLKYDMASYDLEKKLFYLRNSVANIVVDPGSFYLHFWVAFYHARDLDF